MYQPGDDASHLLIADEPRQPVIPCATLICEECGDERARESALRADWFEHEAGFPEATCCACSIAEARGVRL